MARKGRAPNRKVESDPIFNNPSATRTINKIMEDGKKSLAQTIFYRAMSMIEERTGEHPVEILEDALNNVMPALEVKSRRVGGATYQVPVEVSDRRKRILALRWIVESAKNRSERRMEERLAREILDAQNGEGTSVRKKEEMHRMAEANKAFAHYRW